jgi:predicted ATPase
MESGHFIKSIEFLKDYRCFSQGDCIEFRPGMNLLVGDQGCGKSTLLNLMSMRDWQWKEVIKLDAESVQMKHFDFERDNSRMQRGFAENLPTMLQCQMQWSSHGEVNRLVLASSRKYGNLVLLIDEPDQAMSVRSIFAMQEVFKRAVDRGCQVILSAHNPKLIELQELVYDLEQRAWVSPAEFIERQSQLTPEVLSQFGLEEE